MNEVNHMFRHLSLIYRNSLRNRRRSLLTIVSIAASLCLLSLLLALYHSFYFTEASPDQALRLITRHRFNVTAHPTAVWTAQQMIEAFPEDTAPRYLLRDRDQIYGEEFRFRVVGMQIEEVITAPQSPFQNPYVERMIGSIRRECLNHLMIVNEDHLRRILREYFDDYHNSRPHQSLGRNSPIPREIELPTGEVVSIPQVGGLHHLYRRAA